MGVMDSLQTIDEQITKASGGKGEPGSGLYNLLGILAGQFMGVPRSPPPAAPGAAEDTNAEDEGSAAGA